MEPRPSRSRASPTLARAWCAALDLLFPRRCAACGKSIPEPDGSQVCARCLRDIPRIDRDDACERCGLPLGPYADDHEGKWCEGCRTLPFAGFRSAFAVGTYEGALRRAICRFKYGRRPHLARTLGGMIARLARDEYVDECDEEAAGGEADSAPEVVVSVPLHAARRKARTFDQAELLAEAVAEALEIDYALGAMARVVDTPTLTRQSREQRAETVKGAFRILKPAAVEGRCVLLVDDVMTTGATASECARVLKEAGAKQIAVCVLARTP
jgi:ComF family protein